MNNYSYVARISLYDENKQVTLDEFTYDTKTLDKKIAAQMAAARAKAYVALNYRNHGDSIQYFVKLTETRHDV